LKGCEILIIVTAKYVGEIILQLGQYLGIWQSYRQKYSGTFLASQQQR